jgi:hypothetical protein
MAMAMLLLLSAAAVMTTSAARLSPPGVVTADDQVQPVVWPAFRAFTPRPSAAPSALPPAAGCTKLEATNDQASWFDTDEENNVDTQKVVHTYDSGVTSLAAGFEYSCVPKNTTITVVWYSGGFDTEPWFTDKRPQKPTNAAGIYYNSISLKDGSPIPDGDYQVQFYNKKTLLASGEVTVGGKEPGPTPKPPKNTVKVRGVVTDADTQNPIYGAVFVVLNPGVSMQQWMDYGFPPSDMLATAKANRKGEFSVPTELKRDVTYSIIAWALSYQGYGNDNFVIGPDDPDPMELAIELSR